ncbi:family 78 glycoside hydrolase catalytic domain [uncultured Alistipes sp.]|uniref:family 78 glycoside hydrolase catalytic domain n=1 Tax=uncultured Alistipes sp. TaxID=538949 RepID=UPI002603E5E8|nr:family 78 glycoside hydrolase catalytic domain [uncultured Alistipes sp.]
MMNKKILMRLCGWLLLLPAATAHDAFGQRFSVAQMRCDRQADPIGVETPAPRFGWQLHALDRNMRQSAYRILVADSPEALERGDGNMWDSKKVASSRSLQIPYAGRKLEAGKTYYWKVQVWDAAKKASAWSRPGRFSMGLLDRADWSDARWIALENDIDSLTVTDGMAPKNKKSGYYKLPLLRREFRIDRPVRQATAYICGLGQFELFLNGEKTGDHFLDPAWTKFDRSVQYVTFDVTDRLREGGNAVGVMLGNGFFNIPNERYTKFVGSYGAPKMIFKLQIEYGDGSTETLVSDAAWKATPGPVTFSSIYGGEDYDANLEQKGWNEAGFDDSGWSDVVPASFDSPLVSQRTTPLEIRQAIPTFRKYRNGRGNYLYDLGQNASGIVRLKIKADGRHTVRMFPSELQGADSTADQRSSGGPYILSYTTRGDGTQECWQPRFTYYGFRYVEVEGAVPAGEPNPDGLPEITELTGLHTTNSAEAVGSFECSNPLFNRIYTLIDWAIRSNFSSVFTDCPHREKLGWLEQAHLIGPSMQYGYDISRAFPKIVRDMAEAQHPDGMIPTIAPQYTIFAEGFLDTPEWGSAFVLIPWYLYRWYGDTEPMTENYDRMAAYVDYLGSKAEGHIVAYGLGDWCDLGPGEPAHAQLTSNALSATAIYYHDICIMRQAAQVLGKTEDADRYEKLAAEVKKAFNARFFDEKTLRYDRNSQAANAMVLYMGLCEPQHEETVLRNLVDDIRSRGNALTAGDVGYRYVVQALSDHGASDVLFDMNSRYDVPGYGYQLVSGETSLAESWQSKDYLSHNHCMLGHLYSWLFSSIGGISQTPSSVAYREIVIDPQVVGDIREARTSFRSPYGLVRSEWRSGRDEYRQSVEIPANTTALVCLPTDDPSAVFESGLPLGERKEIAVEKREKGRLVLRVGSGSYDFRVKR